MTIMKSLPLAALALVVSQSLCAQTLDEPERAFLAPNSLTVEAVEPIAFPLVETGEANTSASSSEEPMPSKTVVQERDRTSRPTSLASPDRDFSVIVAPYVWIPNVAGDIRLGAQGIPLDLDAGDLLDVFEFGGLIRGEVRHKSGWGLSVDYIFADLGTGVDIVVGDVDADIDAGILEIAAIRRFESGADAIDIYAGIRRWDADVDLVVDTFFFDGNITTGDQWTDPMVGVRYLHPLSERWRLIAQGDIGGFGVGSDFSWNAALGVSLAISDRSQIQIVYRTLNVDRESPGIGASSPVDLDLTIQGPLIGFASRF